MSAEAKEDRTAQLHHGGFQGRVELGFIVAGLTAVAVALEFDRAWLAVALVAHGVWDALHDPARHVVGTRGIPHW